ncbi:MAG TPA: hypothetical protein VFB66_06870 [Tepidisphaeraceae bacterium]|nr:hypothetical protein [Tepidisphaeraceae bacterium]
MSFVHHTQVGHFDPKSLTSPVTRPIDPGHVARLLEEFPEEVAAHVTLRDGYAHCNWAIGGSIWDAVRVFAYRLAREAGCLAVENRHLVTYPPQAARGEGRALGAA